MQYLNCCVFFIAIMLRCLPCSTSLYVSELWQKSVDWITNHSDIKISRKKLITINFKADIAHYTYGSINSHCDATKMFRYLRFIGVPCILSNSLSTQELNSVQSAWSPQTHPVENLLNSQDSGLSLFLIRLVAIAEEIAIFIIKLHLFIIFVKYNWLTVNR